MTYEEYEKEVFRAMDDWYNIPAEYREDLLAKGCIKAAYEVEKNTHEMHNWG